MSLNAGCNNGKEKHPIAGYQPVTTKNSLKRMRQLLAKLAGCLTNNAANHPWISVCQNNHEASFHAWKAKQSLLDAELI